MTIENFKSKLLFFCNNALYAHPLLGITKINIEFEMSNTKSKYKFIADGKVNEQKDLDEN